MPAAQELFMNGEHLATSRYELGDVTLDTERSDSIDLTFNFNANVWYGSASVFHSQIDNYIYLRDELEEEHEEHMAGDHDDDEHEGEGHVEHGDLTLAEYTQQDAEFTGYEIEVGARFELPRGQLQLSLARDEVEAEFSDGQDVPRITPARNMFTARYTLDDFSVSVLVKDVEQQKNVALGESTTDGFTLVNANASWSYGLNDSTRFTLSAFARNLTDEIGRNHASFVKDQVPLPGRNIGVRLRFDF
jgi:iron complex outermembrane receptor protein